jgi:hypothetical protein
MGRAIQMNGLRRRSMSVSGKTEESTTNETGPERSISYGKKRRKIGLGLRSNRKHFTNRTRELMDLRTKCIEKQSDYVEKYNISLGTA